MSTIFQIGDHLQVQADIDKLAWVNAEFIVGGNSFNC